MWFIGLLNDAGPRIGGRGLTTVTWPLTFHPKFGNSTAKRPEGQDPSHAWREILEFTGNQWRYALAHTRDSRTVRLKN